MLPSMVLMNIGRRPIDDCSIQVIILMRVVCFSSILFLLVDEMLNAAHVTVRVDSRFYLMFFTHFSEKKLCGM